MSSVYFTNLCTRNPTYTSNSPSATPVYILTIEESGRQVWTTNLNINSLIASTMSINSLFANDLYVSTTHSYNTIIYSTLIGVSLSAENATIISTLTAPDIITSSIHYSTITGSSINTDYLTINKSTGISTITATTINYSTMSGSSINTDYLAINKLTGASTITATTLNYSTMTGSSINTDYLTINKLTGASTITATTLNYSTMTGSSINTDYLTINKLTGASTITATTVNYSTMIGSSINTNYVNANNSIKASYLSASYAIVTDTSKVIQTSATTSTELSYLTGCTQNVQAQINSLASQVNTLSAALPAGVIMMWSGSVATIPTQWRLCDGNSGRPDLRDKFIVGAGNTYTPGVTGGNNSITLSVAQMPSHTHSINTSDLSHTHNLQTGVYNSANSGSGQCTKFGAGNDECGGSRMYGNTTDTTYTNATVNTTATGSGAAINIMPSYYALCYIIKL
jgi:microcystin-dependent protein